MRRSGTSSAGFAISCVIAALCARGRALQAGDARVDRGEIRRRRCEVAGRRFEVLISAVELFGLRAQAVEIAAQAGQRFLQPAEAACMRRIGRGGRRLAALVSRLARRPARSSIAPALTAGAPAGVGGGFGRAIPTAGQRDHQLAAASARQRRNQAGRERGPRPAAATTVAAGGRRATGGPGLAGDFGASRSMVGGSRLARPAPLRLDRFGAVVDHPWFPCCGSGSCRIRPRPSSAIRPQRTVDAPNRAFSSGEAATTTWEAPASRTTAATPAEIQHCGSESADISTPADRAASRNARALRPE